MNDYYVREDDDRQLLLDESVVYYHATRLEQIAAKMLELAKKVEAQVKYHEKKRKEMIQYD